VSSISTIASLDSPVRQCSQYGAVIDDIVPWTTPRTSAWIRANTWPRSASLLTRGISVPPESSEGHLTPRCPFIMPFILQDQGVLGKGESSATSSSNVGRQPDSREQSSSGTSGGVLVSTFSEGGPLPDLIPSTMKTPRFGLSKDLAVSSGAAEPRGDCELLGYMVGMEQHHANQESSTCEWARHLESIHGSWQKGSPGSCKFPSSQALPLVCPLKHSTCKRRAGPMSRRQRDYQGYSESRRYEDNETMNTADEGPQKHASSLGSHSATTSVAESKVSVAYPSPSISRKPVQPNFGRRQPGMGTGSR
jgi:hypothetical protein